jgi:Ca-activated chloride channel family protein
MLETFISQFHFIRPLWLWALLPVGLLFALLWKAQQRKSHWQDVISPELLPFLLESGQQRHHRHLLVGVVAGWILATLALAGPTWSKLPQPVHQREDALLIIMDLTLSLYATDAKPSRLVQAQRKLTDILQARSEGLTALVVYSGDAHVVSPLTDDTATIAAMVPALAPNIMPSFGSNAASAFELATRMMQDSGITQARILLITDELLSKDQKAIRKIVSEHALELSILGIGTQDGAPIPISEGGFLKDNKGAIVIAQLNRTALQKLASSVGGRYQDARLDDADIRYLLPKDGFSENTRQIEREFDIWQEQGHWLVLLLLPLVALAFRRGWLLSALLAVMLTPEKASALDWQDLWKNKDQQGAEAFSQGEYERATELFKSNEWRGSAQYKAGDFKSAAETFAATDTADANYNRGNALARAGKLDDAISAYERALELDPGMQDAADNKAMLEEIKKQQQQQQDQQNPSDSDSDKDQNSDKQSPSSRDQQDQSQEQENADNSQSEDQSGNQSQQPSDQQQSDQADKSEQEQAEQNSSAEEEKAQQNTEKETDQAAEDSAAQAAQQAEETLDAEQQQALEQWLRRVPDDPGGLLKRKFDYQYRQKYRDNQPSNTEEQQVW